MATTLLRFATLMAVGGSVVAVAVPAFVRNLSASKWSEPIDGLAAISRGALAHAASHDHEVAFPPAAPLTPEVIPRGVRARPDAEAWSHLSWRALDFHPEGALSYSYRFDSALDPASRTFSFAATAQGDLDGDGNASTFQVQGVKLPGQAALVREGLLIHREVE